MVTVPFYSIDSAPLINSARTVAPAACPPGVWRIMAVSTCLRMLSVKVRATVIRAPALEV
ncbi:MAG: hypothetical protein AVDCRST_MAG75-2875 [uncultured Propionibacteriaceae bacterium]|uniref:Uncharacterized protein n=1 Tax=uncultured Propionibacteriaceae bacterium TaxID=257457 RepID=A0A6N3IZ44_9ACTN|nr:MAG: hypothetical protein AVDCRST_MAG75-2875 [uncultured Propionibacteriaceae bacterium]